MRIVRARVEDAALVHRNLGLYQRLGFEVVAVEPHPRGPDKTIWMLNRLVDSPAAHDQLREEG